MGFGQAFKDQSVFITGHTGFKGSWLTEWLLQLGARPTGYSLPTPTNPSLFEQLGLASRMVRHVEGNITHRARLTDALLEAQPSFVFHLAAQPLVRESYRTPVETYTTNVLGTLHVLEALRQLERPCAVIMVTTDKCYENREDAMEFREEDPLGGHDPYSSSKAAMEIAVSSWRRSFFHNHPVKIATGRAGNVIGGGDWAQDRIVPDCIRAIHQGAPIAVRNPHAVRPWQHVLEPLSGYLWLAARLAGSHSPSELAHAFNFGPADTNSRSVRELTEGILQEWPGATWVDQSKRGALHEAGCLRLSIAKAQRVLPWSPVWGFAETIRETVQWYRAVLSDSSAAAALTRQQIETYTTQARALRAAWALS